MKQINGVEVRRIPEVGMGVTKTSGSDRYGYKITWVAEDKTYFKIETLDGFERGYLALDTHKNSTTCGKFVYADVNLRNGKIEPLYRGRKADNYYITEDVRPTELDPSF